MNVKRGRLAIIAALGLAPIVARGQGEDRPATPIVLRPAADPVPALKYRLVPPRHALEPGNAALNYHRAIGMVLELRRAQGPPGAEQQVADWNALPLDQLPVEKARAALEPYRNALAEVEQGTRKASCDWGLSGRAEGVQLIMPEIQESRSLSRLVKLRTRVALREGKLDEAWRWVVVGLTLGRHVAAGDNLVQGLVGVAIASQALGCLEELVQAPGAPNLYWALANRPRPLVDLRPALEGEMTMLDRELPDLAALDDGIWSADQARRFADELQRKLSLFGASRAGSNPFALRLGVAAMALKVYPEAKAALLAEGRPAAEVESMPVVQVAALHAYRTYQRLRDDRFKWLGLPYAQSFGPLNRPAVPTPAEAMGNPLLALFALLEPALNQARLAELRLERHLDALQAIEAIRLHLAANGGGGLPARLEDVRIVPVPPDPITGKPFDYAVQGDTATLAAPIPPGVPPTVPWGLRYTLTRAK